MIRTELEHCALGVVWQRGPCSAYVVRSEFAKSPSGFWSASAGSIYPVVERLIGAGLVEAEAKSDGRRASRLLRITDAGRAALRSWIEELDRGSTSATYDPVRTRLLFLSALPPGRPRRAVLEKARDQTSARLEELRARRKALECDEERMEALATRGAEYELEGRLAWLSEVETQLLNRRA